jgi:aminopeptidase N
MRDWNETAESVIELIAQFYANLRNYIGGIDAGDRLHFLFVPISISGMENDGLIAIRDDLWPDDAIMLTNASKFLQTIGHELTHLWFGNMVSPRSWSDAWLSESMTTMISERAIGDDQ